MHTNTDWATPFERGDGNQTTTWHDCIAFHRRLAAAFPQWLRFEEAGRSDGGTPLHAGVFSPDGVFDPQAAKAEGRPVFFNNNGIHPGEPEGIDACMALVRDLCLDPARRAALGRAVLVYIPVYNVDGALERGDTSRVNQLGPEAFGFRGNARHLDLNRDFVKADSLEARVFAQVFTRWDPDVMVDTHTSNGADYQHVVTLIATQPDKLGGRTGAHLREAMLPALYADMAARGFPMCPYVNPVQEIPDDGIADFLDSPRFSTGYAALHHTIGFMPETHMLKPFDERYRGTRALLDAALAWTTAQG
ncbi:MAG TPA: M14 family zinc carboxypeptidase, partial [Burkholderiaceae bacterium]